MISSNREDLSYMRFFEPTCSTIDDFDHMIERLGEHLALTKSFRIQAPEIKRYNPDLRPPQTKVYDCFEIDGGPAFRSPSGIVYVQEADLAGETHVVSIREEGMTLATGSLYVAKESYRTTLHDEPAFVFDCGDSIRFYFPRSKRSLSFLQNSNTTFTTYDEEDAQLRIKNENGESTLTVWTSWLNHDGTVERYALHPCDLERLPGQGGILKMHSDQDLVDPDASTDAYRVGFLNDTRYQIIDHPQLKGIYPAPTGNVYFFTPKNENVNARKALKEIFKIKVAGK